MWYDRTPIAQFVRGGAPQARDVVAGRAGG
jgi:hypothetical protein